MTSGSAIGILEIETAHYRCGIDLTYLRLRRGRAPFANPIKISSNKKPNLSRSMKPGLLSAMWGLIALTSWNWQASRLRNDLDGGYGGL